MSASFSAAPSLAARSASSCFRASSRGELFALFGGHREQL